MAYGRCRLTGHEGKLVRSHLLPKSVTRAPDPGEPRVDGYAAARPVKRFDSWYDPTLVTRAGEDILSDYDDWAIKELRRLQLIWSAWGDLESLPAQDVEWPQGSSLGLRHLECIDVRKLRLFFLSLLWRAASTSLEGFKVAIASDKVEALRQMIVAGNPKPTSMFPVALIQLSTKGPWHNAGPRVESLADGTTFFRFYFDGLIAHIYDDVTDDFVANAGALILGESSSITVMTRPYEESAQREWLHQLITNIERDHFDTVERIFGRR